MTKRALLNSNEKVINFYKPAKHMPKDKVFLCEQTLTDKSLVYAVLIGNVRFDCMNLKQAQKLYDMISKEIINFELY